jgi:transposase
MRRRLNAYVHYARDGRIEMGNNAIEYEIRPIALGRNWLFAGSDQVGHRAVAMHTLLNTAKLNRINPEKYLHHVLAKIDDHTFNKVDEFLPWNVNLEKDESSITDNLPLAAQRFDSDISG